MLFGPSVHILQLLVPVPIKGGLEGFASRMSLPQNEREKFKNKFSFFPGVSFHFHRCTVSIPCIPCGKNERTHFLFVVRDMA